MSNHARDYDKTVALLKSIAAPCQSDRRNAEHSWRHCRHCLAVAELEDSEVRARLAAFLLAVEVADQNYGKAEAR
jgi:hypothetical protein